MAHHKNSIIIQESAVAESGSSAVTLEPDYNFKRQEHQSFKGSEFNVPNVNFKRFEAKLKEFKSDLAANNVRTVAEKSNLRMSIKKFQVGMGFKSYTVKLLPS